MSDLKMSAGGILKRLRILGKLSDADVKDLSLVRRAANREKVIMAKSKDNDDDPQTYDFSEIEDKTKNALALSYEAIKGDIDSLPDEVGEFFKSAAEELDLETTVVEVHKAEHENETEEEKKKRLEELKKAEEAADKKEAMKKTEMIKSAFPGVLEAAQKAAVEPLQVEIKKAQDDLSEMRDKLQRDEMRIFARGIISGDDEPSDEKINELITIKKSMDEKSWKTYTESQRGLVTQIEKSALFERQTNPTASSAGSAYGKLEEIVKSVIEKSEDKNYSTAWDYVISTNPVLYEQYRTEQAAQSSKVGATS